MVYTRKFKINSVQDKLTLEINKFRHNDVTVEHNMMNIIAYRPLERLLGSPKRTIVLVAQTMSKLLAENLAERTEGRISAKEASEEMKRKK